MRTECCGALIEGQCHGCPLTVPLRSSAPSATGLFRRDIEINYERIRRLEESHARLLEALIAALNDSGCDGDLCSRQWHDDARAAIKAALEIK